MSDAIAKALAEEAQIHLQGPSTKVTNQDTMSYALGKEEKKVWEKTKREKTNIK